jgi:hypothetical protein
MFGLMLLAGAVAIATLRPDQNRRWLRIFGLATVGLSLCLLLVQSFDTSGRLMAYGILAFALSFKPRPGGDAAWVLYGLVGLLCCLVNLVTVNSYGANDPRYQELTREAAAMGLGGSGRLLTNAYFWPDVHARVPSWPIDRTTDLAAQPPGTRFLWVSLPNYDAVFGAVYPMSPPGPGWSRVWEIDGAVLFSKDS